MDKNNKEIIDQVERIRKKFRSETNTDPKAAEMSFIEEMNDIVRNIFKDEPVDIYDVLSQENLNEWKKRNNWKHKLKKNFSWNKLFMGLLLLTTTGFLVSEAAAFYSIDGVIDTSTWIKAILTEVCFVFVSSYRADTKIMSGVVNFARVGIFALMLFVVSSEVTLDGINKVNKIDVITEKIELIEDQIKKKEELINFYLKKGWGINAKQQETEKQKLVEELIKLKNQQIDGANEKSSNLEILKTWAKGFFRVVLMFINILISRRLFKF
jgi:hypothetical protein